MRYLTKAVASAMPHPSPDSSLTIEHAEPATRRLSKKLALCGRRLKDKRPPESKSSSSSTAEFYARHSGTGAGQTGTRRRLHRGESRQSSGLATRAGQSALRRLAGRIGPCALHLVRGLSQRRRAAPPSTALRARAMQDSGRSLCARRRALSRPLSRGDVMQIDAFTLTRLPRIVFGAGRLAELPQLAREFGTRALLVTGARSFAASPAWGPLVDALRRQGVSFEHEIIEGEPSPLHIDAAVARQRDQGIDVVVGIGGGSVLDAGKAIAGMLRHEGSVMHYLEGVGSGVYSGPAVPFIAAPTTAGTGSEATKNAVLSVQGPQGFKKSFRHECLVPAYAVIDPELLRTCPPAQLAANGMDALTQLIESYVSNKANPISDALARSGIRAVKCGFFAAWRGDGADADAGRAAMAYGALLSGITLAQVGLGSVHGLASPLGAYFPIPHGVVCGTLLAAATEVNVHALRARAPGSPALMKYAEIGELLSGTSVEDRDTACETLIATLEDRTRRCAPRSFIALLLGCIALLPIGRAHAQTLPAWEVGLGLGVISVPFYRGADRGRTYLIPVPYLVYRGRFLQMDEAGIRGKLFTSDRLKLDVSLAAGVPVPEENDGVRSDMPTLSPTVALGPQLEYRMWRAQEGRGSLWLHLPVRSAFSVNFGEFRHQGWIFSPYIEYETRDGSPDTPWAISIGAGPLFADRSYHDYFYEVLSSQATAARPEYHPDGGYSGSRVTLTVHRRIGRWWFGAFARADDLHGAVFANSPLGQKETYYAVGAAVVRMLATSRERVEGASIS